MGYDFDLIYRSEKENVVVDALSRKEEEVGPSSAVLMALTLPISKWMEVLEREWLVDPKLQKIIEELKIEPTRHPSYTWNHDQLRYKGRLVLGTESKIKEKVLHATHDSPLGGHLGVHRTLRRIKQSFH